MFRDPLVSSQQIRTEFVDFFKRYGHTQVPSSSLIPEGDPSLLFANAGMNQFKNTFLGLENRSYKRAVSVQKCVRAGGKHNDLENVGFTARHHTFFEMLGNFSFGDYFKKDAIHFAWELLTKVYQIPKDLLYVTVFQDDDEAADIWHKQEQVPRDRIFRLGEKDNFWRMGDTGPCGPSSEIFFDHGTAYGSETDPFKGIVAGEDRFIEIWNLVFMQFYEKSPGEIEPLPKPSVDTGSGFERLVAALQGKHNNYNTDLFTPMISKACSITGKDYVTDAGILEKQRSVWEVTSALRVLADHARACGFLIADGALPANEGRGYVLRRILRRAFRFGRKLDETKSILPSMVEVLVQNMSSTYPELETRRKVILNVIKEEEGRFSSTLDQGTEVFNAELKQLREKNLTKLSGSIVFKLYDTFGFPVDLTQLMALEQGVECDLGEFEKLMEESKTRSRSTWRGHSITGDEAHMAQWLDQQKQSLSPTQFLGYECLQAKAQAVSLSDGHKEVDHLSEGQTGYVILDKTPFYAEGGGQVGDSGLLKLPDGGEVEVITTKKFNEFFLHTIKVTSGNLNKKDFVSAEVTASERRDTACNHSATHLMHAALKKILGSHVGQSGSLVDSERLRFDFTHGKPLTKEEKLKIEILVNEQIALALPVQAEIKSQKEALAQGAVAMFGEKYGDEVRVLSMGDFSCELCGGTHVRNTAEIRWFKIVSEGGVSAGVRRIEAITGSRALDYASRSLEQFDQARLAAGLNTSWQNYAEKSKADLSTWIESKNQDLKTFEREIRTLKGSSVSIEQIMSSAIAIETSRHGSLSLIFVQMNLEDREVLSQLSDQVKSRFGDSKISGIYVLIGNGPLVVGVTQNLTKSIKAGDLLKIIGSIMEGKGGGRPDFAQGNVQNLKTFEKAKAAVLSLLQNS